MPLALKKVCQLFSDVFREYDYKKIKGLISEQKVSEEGILRILEKAGSLIQLNFEDLLFLLHPDSKKYIQEVQKIAHKLTIQRHGKVIKFYAPVYLSNECCNSCIYCGFNIKSPIVRKTLSIDEIEQEIKAIKELGIQHILAVSGESRGKIKFPYLSDACSLLAKKFPSTSIEFAPMELDEYKHLFDIGIEGVVSYQETYNTELYAKYHPAGPKKSMPNRLNTLDRAGQAGMRFVGLGALLGLSELAIETFFMALHARYLEKKYWRTSVNLSFPRIRPSETGFIPPYSVSDEELFYTIAILRLFLPDSNLVLSTREAPETRDVAVLYGINQMSAGSKTQPLGYTETKEELHAGNQFYIADNRTPEQIAKKLESFGYDPVFKDWDAGFRE